MHLKRAGPYKLNCGEVKLIAWPKPQLPITTKEEIELSENNIRITGREQFQHVYSSQGS